MSKSILFSVSLLLLAYTSFAQIHEKVEPSYISTIQFSGQTDFSQLPIIRLGERLQLSFDALNGQEADFYYTITHHNFDWSPSDLSKSEYLNGFDEVRISSYENSLNTLQIYSHYTLTIPNRDT
ncbi:MAG TPA: type IX secretion system plug protein domain-containing protein, partial [Aequorivita sp.]|nr:type IX secretion system plug protein domain-containing protein [Aequorivita sp.]